MPASTLAPTPIRAALSRSWRPLRLRGAPTVASAIIASLVAAASLTGCTRPDKFAPACPQLSLLRDGADLTRFRPGGQDLTDMVLDAQIKAVPAVCSAGPKGTVQAKLNVSMQLNRGPAAPDRNATVRYFVAVTDGDQVLDEQDYGLHTVFPTNVDRVTVTGEDISLNVPVTPERSAAAYKIYVGFRLTPEELAYNRQRGPR